MENPEDNQNEDRPSAPELLGTAPEQVKRQGEEAEQYEMDPVSEPGSNNSLFQLYIGIASLILLILGLVALGVWLYAGGASNPTESAEEVTPSSLIYAEKKQEVEVENFNTILNKLDRVSAEDLQNNAFSQIYFTHTANGQKSLLEADELLNQLSDNKALIAGYVADNFMYGIYKDETGEESTYLILGITNYDNAYGTMLQTEEELVSALVDLGFPRARDFTDVLIQNQDVRIAGGSGGARIFYSFPRQNRLVITTSEKALREIFDRLRRR